jgi:tubulin beta
MLQAFQLTHSVGGGTGSGLGSLLLQKLAEEYPDKLAFNFSVFPSPAVSNVVVEPYNAVLTSFHLIESSAATFLLENEALTNVLTRQLKIQSPSFADLNFTVA